MRDDVVRTRDVLKYYILPQSQHFAYLEIQRESGGTDSDLMQALKGVSSPRLAIQAASKIEDIYGVFRKLFEDNGLTDSTHGGHGRSRAAALEL